MSAPKRIQLRRTKGWRKPEGAVVVTRGTDWGNPYRIGDLVHIETPSVWDKGAHYVYGPTITREIAVLLFLVWVNGRLEDQIRSELAGKDLACWCALGQPCHADVLLEIANGSAK
jgi:hypothetical protein